MENKQIQILKRNADFLRVKKSGRRFLASEWLLVNYTKSSTNSFRYGITVSRKVGEAVMRNKLKRWVREEVRAYLGKQSEISVDVNFIFKAMPEGFYKKLLYSEFKKDFFAALDRLRKNCEN